MDTSLESQPTPTEKAIKDAHREIKKSIEDDLNPIRTKREKDFRRRSLFSLVLLLAALWGLIMVVYDQDQQIDQQKLIIKKQDIAIHNFLHPEDSLKKVKREKHD